MRKRERHKIYLKAAELIDDDRDLLNRRRSSRTLCFAILKAAKMRPLWNRSNRHLTSFISDRFPEFKQLEEAKYKDLAYWPEINAEGTQFRVISLLLMYEQTR